jgi:hypothetical protein
MELSSYPLLGEFSMRQSRCHRFAAVALLAGVVFAASSTPGRGEPAEPETVRVKTADGLNLWGKWFPGGKGQKSDAVILVHAYGSNASDGKSGPWEPLAKALQKEGYSVIMFDLRGHGRSTDFKVLDDKKAFSEQQFNKLAGYGSTPAQIKAIKELKKERFSPGYYPYLINDITGARLFIDDKNDKNECNAGRVFVIADGNISPLVMLWLTTEWLRAGVGPATRMDVPKPYVAGKDLAGAIFLSWTPAGGQGQMALGVADNAMKKEVLYATKEYVREMLRDKVAMAWIYGKGDERSASEARSWFNKFGIAGNKKTDPEKVKYMVEVPGAEKLAGIKLLDIMETRKVKMKDKDDKEVEMEVKGSVVEKQILDFMKATKEKGINGSSTGPKRYVDNYDPVPVPLDMWGLKLP